MKEVDYTNATNLAKLRIADQILRGINLFGAMEQHRAQYVDVLKTIDFLTEVVELAVRRA